MRKARVIENCRCYHLISRLAHRAFFLDDEEKTRAVELLRRVEEFSGVIVLAYAIMSNHFHIFIYVPEPEDIGDEEILRRINALYREASLAQVLGEWTRLKDEEAKILEHARPTGKYVSRFGEYRRSFLRRMWNSSEFMRTYKQHFTMSFNARSDHHGTMWESCYRVRVKDLAECGMMLAESGYVDANPVNAGIETPGYIPQVIAKGDNVRAVRLMQLFQWEPKSPAYLRTTLGITSREYFTKAYLRPLMETGLIKRSDPGHPNSPQQKYALTKDGKRRIERVAPL